MHFLDGSVSAFLETAFAQRVSGSVTVTDSFPAPAVFFVAVGRPFVTVVILPHGFPVFFTIRTVREPTASGIRHGRFGFLGMKSPHFPGMRKAPRDCSHEAF
jgi:hypothetical protein